MWEDLFPLSETAVARAVHRARRLLPHADLRVHGGTVSATEVFEDLDGNCYRIEYVLEAGGDRTRAYCRARPRVVSAWGWWRSYSVRESHLHEDGTLCLGQPNAMSFERAVERAHFWANAHTFLMEHGLEETRRLVPEW